MKKKFYAIVSVVFLYILIYNPVFFNGFDPMLILYPLIFVLFFNINNADKYFLKNICVKWSFVLAFLVIKTIEGGNSIYLFSWIGTLLETILISYVMAKLMTSFSVDVERALINTGCIAAVISVLCLFIPSLNNNVRSIQMVYSNAYESNFFRGFGLSQGLNYEFGFIQAFVFSLILFYRGVGKKLYLCFVPILLLSILINARSGVLAVIISCIVYFLYSEHQQFGKKILSAVAVICLMYFAYNQYYSYIPDTTSAFIEEFFLEVKDAILGTNEAKYNTSEELTSNMIILPKNIEDWVYGTGISLFGVSSDVGFINQLSYGGLIYMLLLYIFDYSLVKESKLLFPKGLLLIFITSMLLANIKGGILGGNNGAIRLIAFLSSYYYIKRVVKTTMNSVN